MEDGCDPAGGWAVSLGEKVQEGEGVEAVELELEQEGMVILGTWVWVQCEA